MDGRRDKSEKYLRYAQGKGLPNFEKDIKMIIIRIIFKNIIFDIYFRKTEIAKTHTGLSNVRKLNNII